MSKQQSKKQQKEEQVKFEKIMEMYHHGNQEMAKYLALQAMENYIKSLMKKQFSTYVTKYFDDLLQEGYMAVLEGLRNRPLCSRPVHCRMYSVRQPQCRPVL